MKAHLPVIEEAYYTLDDPIVSLDVGQLRDALVSSDGELHDRAHNVWVGLSALCDHMPDCFPRLKDMREIALGVLLESCQDDTGREGAVLCAMLRGQHDVLASIVVRNTAPLAMA